MNTFPCKPGSAAARFRAMKEREAAASAPSAPPKPTASKPAPSSAAPKAPAATVPTSAPSASRPLTGLQKAIAAHRGEAVTHAPPAEATGLQKAIAAHRKTSKH